MHAPSTRRNRSSRLFPVAIIVLSLFQASVTPIAAQQATEPTIRTSERDYASDPYWQQAKKEVYKSTLELMAQDQNELLHGLRLHKLIRGNPRKKQIALTFDDGPHPVYTPQLLDLLARENVKATFFVVGEMAEKYPDLVRAELAAGHVVGNHTYHHVNLTKILEPDVATEITACGDALQRITGQTAHFFRPPGGDYDAGVATTSEALGYTIVLWTDDPGDYANPGDQVILRRTLKLASKGGIILIHDGVQETINILPQLIATLRKQGYQFVTVEDMMNGRR